MPCTLTLEVLEEVLGWACIVCLNTELINERGFKAGWAAKQTEYSELTCDQAASRAIYFRAIYFNC